MMRAGELEPATLGRLRRNAPRWLMPPPAFLSGITNYYACGDIGGYVQAVAHGADFALQLALNPAVTKAHHDQLLPAIATQVAPRDTSVTYWAGEPDRLARAVVFIAQRNRHSDAEWKTWFEKV